MAYQREYAKRMVCGFKPYNKIEGFFFESWGCDHCKNIGVKTIERTKYPEYEIMSKEHELELHMGMYPKIISELDDGSYLFFQILNDLHQELIISDYFEGVYHNRSMLLDAFHRGEMYSFCSNYDDITRSYLKGYRCFWVISKGDSYPNIRELIFIWIHPEDRRKGLGTRIVQHFNSIINYKKVISVRGVEEFWKKMGFEYRNV